MYDPTHEAHEFFGATREEAVSKACGFYGREEGELDLHEFGEGEVSGLGARVLVVAIPKGISPPGKSAPAERRGVREEGRERGGRERERGGRERERGGRDRERGGRNRTGRERGARREFAAAPRGEESEEDLGPSVGTVQGEIGPAGDFIRGVIERMKIGPFEIAETHEANFLIYRLSGPAARRLASGEGKAKDAVQILAGQVLARLEDEPRRVVVDAEGDLERRQDFLTRIAERAARRAEDTGRSVALDPMDGRDRRVIHLALRDEEGIATMSIGEGRYRQVLVVPEGAPEYDEAVDASREAASRED